MASNEEAIVNVTKYLRKIQNLILNDAKFVFLGKNYVDTKRLNDLFCCVDASWPEEYTTFLSRQGDHNLKTPILYKKLKQATKNKFILSDSICVVNKDDAISAMNSIISSIKLDIKYIENSR